MVFKVCFSQYLDNDVKELNIDLENSNPNVVDENDNIVGTVKNFAEFYNELMYDEKTCYGIEFFLVSKYYNINFELSDKQVYEILDGLNINGVRTP